MPAHWRFMLEKLLMTLMILDAAVLLGGMVWMSAKWIQNRDPDKMRKRHAMAQGIKALSALSLIPDRQVFIQAQAVFLDALSLWCDQPLQGVPMQEIQDILGRKQFPSESVDEVLRLLDRLSFGAYAPSMQNVDVLKALLADIKALMFHVKR